VAEAASVDRIVVACSEERHNAVRALARSLGIGDLICVDGGARRRDSVASGLAASEEAEMVAIHDAARPLVSAGLLEAVIAAARAHGAATAAIPCVDTIKRIAAGMVVETIPRQELVAVQTPQAFAASLLRRAHAASDEDVSDDCALVERLGAPVAVVPGEVSNRKVTHVEDLDWLRARLSEASG
jgi:2-C-methyl-D-erythritol 4-phosphate cytidylyltransferase